MSIANLPDEAARREPDDADAVISPWEEGDQAENELRWYYCQSGGDLGEHSAWNALVQMAQAGGHQGTRLEPYVEGEVTAPVPTNGQIWAAARQARVREALRQLPKPDQSILEWKYSQTKPDTQVRGLLGKHDAEHLEPIVTQMIRRKEIAGKMDGTGDWLPPVIALAQERLSRALAGYRANRGIGLPRAERRNQHRAPRELVAAGVNGAAKRRLVPVEAPRRVKA